MSLKITSNFVKNNGAQISFGRVSFVQPNGQWAVMIEKEEPNKVYVEGFSAFTSKEAGLVSKEFKKQNRGLLNPDKFEFIKENLLKILKQAKEELPLFNFDTQSVKELQRLIVHKNTTAEIKKGIFILENV